MNRQKLIIPWIIIFWQSILLGMFCFSTCMGQTSSGLLPITRFSKKELPKKSQETENNEKNQKEIPDVSTCFIVGGPILKLQVAPHRRYLAVSWWDASSIAPPESDGDKTNVLGWYVDLWNIEYNDPFREADEVLGQTQNVMSSTFDTKGNLFFVADADSKRPSNRRGQVKTNVRVLIPEERKQYLALLTDSFDESRIRLSPGAKWIACQDRQGIWRLIDRTDPLRVVSFPEIEVEVAESQWKSSKMKKGIVTEILAFSPDLEFVATLVSDREESDISYSDLYRTIVIWDLHEVSNVKLEDAKLPLQTFEISRFKVSDGVEWRRCAFSFDGKIIAVRSKSRHIGIWQTSSGRLIAELGEHAQPITSLQFLPNNIKLVVGSGETRGRVTIWDIRKETVDRSYEVQEHDTKRVTAVTSSPNGDHIYFGTDTGAVMKWVIQKPPKK